MRSNCTQTPSGLRFLRRTARRCRQEDFVNIDVTDLANLADVADAPLWEFEIPLTDDGF